MYLGTRDPGILRQGGEHVSQSWDVYTWVLGNPEIFRHGGGGGGYRCLNPGMYILGY